MLLSVAVFAALLAQPPKTAPAPKLTPRRAAKPAATATPIATPAPPLPDVPFADGETSSYDVSWSAMTAGQATLSIRASRGASGIDAWNARADATPSSMLSALYTLRYHAESTFDARTLLPRVGVVDGTEGQRRRIRRTVFNRAAKKARYSVTIGDTVTRSLDIEAESQDILSVLYKMRSLPLARGFRARIPVCDNGHRYAFEISVDEKAMLKTPMGDLPAWKITPRVTDEDGKQEPGQKTLWLSADPRRLLLRVESTLAVGKVTLALAAYTPGRS